MSVKLFEKHLKSIAFICQPLKEIILTQNLQEVNINGTTNLFKKRILLDFIVNKYYFDVSFVLV